MKQSASERALLAADRPERSREIFTPNSWYGYVRALKDYAGVDRNPPLKAVLQHGAYLWKTVWDQEVLAKVPSFFLYSPYLADWLRERVRF